MLGRVAIAAVMLAATGLAVFGVFANRSPLPALGVAVLAVWLQVSLSSEGHSGLAALLPFTCEIFNSRRPNKQTFMLASKNGLSCST